MAQNRIRRGSQPQFDRRARKMANYPDLKLYVDAEWRQADDQAVVNPADESVLGTVPPWRARA